MHSTHTMDLRDCERLIALVEHGSFAAAARALELSQPALTRAVQALERRLGTAVFVRSSAGVQPTDVGLVLLERARDLLTRAGEIDAAIGRAGSMRGVELNLAFGPYPAAMLLERALVKFCAAAPNVAVRTFIGDWADVLQRVRTGQADLAVLELSLALDDPLLETQRLREHAAHWVVRRGHPLDRGRDATLAEILEHRTVAPTRMPPRILEPLLRARRGAGAGFLPSLVHPDLKMNVRLAIALDLVAALPLRLVRDELAAGTLVAIGHEPWMRTQFGIALPRRQRSSAAMAFAEVLAEVDAHFSDDPSPQVPAAVAVVPGSKHKARQLSRRT
jgi:DNA-binding transcriptional LysR family regulator